MEDDFSKNEIPAPIHTDDIVKEIENELMGNNKKPYITSKDFRIAYNESVEKGEPTEKLLKCFKKIAQGWGKRYPNTNEQDLDTYIWFAVSEAWRKWKRYDPAISGNLFAFFTSVIKNDMALAHNKLHKNKHLHISIDGLYVNQSQL